MATANCLFNMELLSIHTKTVYLLCTKRGAQYWTCVEGWMVMPFLDCIDLIKKKIQLGKYSNFKAHIYEIFLYSIILYS